ncbi:hypothetical protein [Staphylothermus hellenicus]|uniref:Uncharacterized protein n=1 Tax=Staphylothermus hellenicus (strain DSM 12710 / JCM 10830 / BK20S6-10-b1 / P8) TaxID=591019 RepID=D7DB54_STAHD|nr:hypothetical protein [Staphylothermus hellenicus]ADI31401.1 hypothetical protein Shell_0263 [Staphylothermus hellenicus DSM 12710]
MEIMLEQPYFVGEDMVKQRFIVRSRNILWKGNVEAARIGNLGFNKIKKIISNSISDANRGYTYEMVGRINSRYMYEVRLVKSNTLKYDGVSSVQIKIYETNGKAFMNMDIVPHDYA